MELLILVMSGISLIFSFFFSSALPADPAWLAVLLCGIPIIKSAAAALVSKFDVKSDLLVSLALIASVIIGEIFAAGEIAFIMALGAVLEERTVEKARAGIEKLVRLTPRTARVIREGDEEIIQAEQVRVGDVLRVLAGETVAVDGVIISGQTSVDQSVMTGESLPADKGVGDAVQSGTVNQFGAFDMRAARVGEDSSLQRMIRLVETADAGKAKIVGLADRWATWVVVVALASAGITWFVTGEIIRAVTILVVFCPCALVLATPTAIMAGIGNAAKHGILIREGDALERLAGVSCVAFDKTGTLTFGRPAVSGFDSFVPDISGDEMFSLTASAERMSEHPLGKAIAAHYKTQYGEMPAEPRAFKMVAGRGVEARVGEKDVLAGNAEMMTEHSVQLSQAVRDMAAAYKTGGSTVIYTAVDGVASGMIALSDQLRGEAAQVIDGIKQIGLTPVLLTGDNARTAAHIAKAAGIAEVYADCLPETKLLIIDRLQKEGRPVCMVGDGVNDAPALKNAYVGVAMGGIGSDIAIDAADIALTGDDIRHLPHLFLLAKQVMRKIKFNLAASMLLNFAAVLLAMTGILSPVAGALVHNAGSVVVIISSSMLLSWKTRSSRF